VLIRISEVDKMAISQAAKETGKTVTSFIVGAALAAVRRTSKHAEARGSGSGARHGGVPNWFRAMCGEAARGGNLGYRDVGKRLAESLGGEIPDGLDLDEWSDALECLRSDCEDSDHEGIWEWFAEYFPKAMKLIPDRRLHLFSDGVLEAHEESGGLPL